MVTLTHIQHKASVSYVFTLIQKLWKSTNLYNWWKNNSSEMLFPLFSSYKLSKSKTGTADENNGDEVMDSL